MMGFAAPDARCIHNPDKLANECMRCAGIANSSATEESYFRSNAQEPKTIEDFYIPVEAYPVIKKRRLTFVHAWFDIWIGFYYNQEDRALYCMIPFIGIRIQF